jgi:hypothetical protein
MKADDDAPAGSSDGNRRGAMFATAMKWVGAASAILALLFSVQRLVVMISDAREKSARIAELLQTAGTQREGGHYAEAWQTLAQAAALDDDRRAVREAQEDLAMEWLRRARATQGRQTFGDIVALLSPVLSRGAATADAPQRSADLTAHLGWADFLLWREGRRELRPEHRYRRALELDPENVYAHAMWAHWILWQDGSPEEARAHFAQAHAAERERAYVRELEAAAWLNRGDAAAETELVRLAAAMSAAGEGLSAEVRRRLAQRLCLGYASRFRPAPGDTAATAVISREDDVRALQWIFAGLELNEAQHAVRDSCLDAARAGAPLR